MVGYLDILLIRLVSFSNLLEIFCIIPEYCVSKIITHLFSLANGDVEVLFPMVLPVHVTNMKRALNDML